MIDPLAWGGVPFHADLSVAAGGAAATRTLYRVGDAELLVTHVRVSSDTAQRVVVGTADAAGQRIVAGWLPSGGSGILADLSLFTYTTPMTRKDLVVITAAISGVDAQVEGYVFSRQLAERYALARAEGLTVVVPGGP